VAEVLQTEYLSRSMYGKHGTISPGAAERTFGSWNEAIVAAGLKPLPSGGIPRAEQQRLERLTNPPVMTPGGSRIPDDELLDELLRLEKVLGRRPSGNQIAAKGKYDPTVYQRRWGSVPKAWEAAQERRDS
jgi:hypothetical protein